jgi:hypothetical protein
MDAASRIEQFLKGIETQLGWTVQARWRRQHISTAADRRLAPAAPGVGNFRA